MCCWLMGSIHHNPNHSFRQASSNQEPVTEMDQQQEVEWETKRRIFTYKEEMNDPTRAEW
jgi:hypothetical protein